MYNIAVVESPMRPAPFRPCPFFFALFFRNSLPEAKPKLKECISFLSRLLPKKQKCKEKIGQSKLRSLTLSTMPTWTWPSNPTHLSTCMISSSFSRFTRIPVSQPPPFLRAPSPLHSPSCRRASGGQDGEIFPREPIRCHRCLPPRPRDRHIHFHTPALPPPTNRVPTLSISWHLPGRLPNLPPVQFDGLQPNWFHFDCFWLKGFPASATAEFEGFGGIRFEDQEKIREKLGGAGAADAAKVVGITPLPAGCPMLQIEYAKSSRSECRNCFEKILMARRRRFILFLRIS